MSAITPVFVGEVKGILDKYGVSFGQLAQYAIEASKKEIKRVGSLAFGGQAPLGYFYSPQCRLEIEPSQAECVRLIFALRRDGLSLRRIAEELTLQGHHTQRGGRWQANTIKTILSNKTYLGSDSHAAIISQADFEEVNGLA